MADNMTSSGLGGSTTDTLGGGFAGQTGASGTGGFGSQTGTSATGGFGSTGAGGTYGDDGQSGIKQQAQEKAQQLRGEAMQLKDQALDKARTAAEEQKSRAANTIEDLAQSARDAVGQLSQNPNIAPVARYGEQAADALERFATTLRNKDIDQLMTEISGMVRRNPAIAVGVAVAAGFALTRVFRGGMNTQSDGDYERRRFAPSNDSYGETSGLGTRSAGGFSSTSTGSAAGGFSSPVGTSTSGLAGSTGGFTGGSTAGMTPPTTSGYSGTGGVS